MMEGLGQPKGGGFPPSSETWLSAYWLYYLIILFHVVYNIDYIISEDNGTDNQALTP